MQKKDWGFLLLGVSIASLAFMLWMPDEQAQIRSLPMYYFSDSIPGFVTASGTWVMKGESLANKYNAAEVNCFNRYGDLSFSQLHKLGLDTSEMYCYIAQGDTIDGHLTADLSLFTITDWDENEVVGESEGLCRKIVMVLDRRAESVSQTGTLVGDKESALCKGLNPNPTLSYLTDGFEVFDF